MKIDYNLCKSNDFLDLNKLFFKCFNFNPGNDYFNWKHLHNPSGRSITIIAIHLNKIIASFTLMPEYFSINKKIKKIYQGVDLFIDPDFRGLGLFKQLVKNVENELSKVDNNYYLFVHSVPLSGIGFAKNPRWRLIKKLDYIFLNKYYFNIKKSINIINKKLNINVSEPKIHELKKFFQKKINLEKSIIKYFNEDIFNWRFIKHPHQKYFFLKILNNQEIETLVVYSKDKKNRIKIEFLKFSEHKKITQDVKEICKFIFKKEKTNWIYTYKNTNNLVELAYKKNGFITNIFNKGIFSFKPSFIVCGNQHINNVDFYDSNNYEIMPSIGD